MKNNCNKNNGNLDDTASLLSIQDAIISSANVMILVVDLYCNVLYVNNYFNTKSKYTFTLGEAFPYEKLFTPDHAEYFYKDALASSILGVPTQKELSLITKDGNVIPIRFSTYPVKDNAGNIFAVALRAEDIMNEKKHEVILEKHQHSQAFLANFSIPFTQPNSFDYLMNYALEQLEGLLHTERIYLYDVHDDYIKLIHEHIRFNDYESSVGKIFPFLLVQDIMDELKDVPYLLFNDVSQHYAKYPYLDYGAVSSLYMALSVDGNLMGFLNFLTVKEQAKWTDEDCQVAAMAGSIIAGAMAMHKSDIALKVAIEDALRANSAKSLFLSNMSHEIRTPLNAIIGMAQIAQRTASSKFPEMEHSINEILSASNHLLSLLNDVLDMSKIESGSLALTSEPFDLLSTMKEVKNIIYQRADESGVQLYTDFSSLDNTVVLGDSLRLRQVLINLLGNAVKFTPEEGTVFFIIRLDKETLESLTVSFIIKDTGLGIDMSQIDSLFQPFQQGTSQIEGRFNGTGLGLPISQTFVEKMGGKIKVQSSPGEGSTFSFSLTFPKYVSKEVIAAEEPASSYDFTGKRILVVEDIAINREILITLLSETNAVFEEASNGKIALELFSAAPPSYYDFIFMDIQMPVMNGLEAAKAIRALDCSDAKTVPIYAMTANAYIEDVEASLAAGMNGHIAKPIDIKSLLAILGKHFS